MSDQPTEVPSVTAVLVGVLVAAGVVAVGGRAAAGPGPLEVAQAVVELGAGADDGAEAAVGPSTGRSSKRASWWTFQ